MTTTNETAAAPADDAAALENLRSGQQMAIIAIVMNLAVGWVWGKNLTPIGWMFVLMACVLALVGVWKLGAGFKSAVATKIGLIVLQFVPLVNLVTLAILSSRATSRLRAGGYKVGFFGASRASA